MISIVVSTLAESDVDELFKKWSKIIQSQVTSLDIEVIIVCQVGSSTITIDPLMSDHANSGVRVLYQNQYGLSRSRNFGATHCSGKWVLFLDDDSNLSDSSFAQFLELSGGPAEDVFCGKVVDQFGCPIVSRVKGETRRLGLLDGHFFQGSAILIKREVFLQFLFDEELGVGSEVGACEDADLFYRLFLAGVSVRYIPSLKIIHPADSDKVNTLGLSGAFDRGYKYGFARGFVVKRFCQFSRSLRLYFILEIVGVIGRGLKSFCTGNWSFASRDCGNCIGKIAGFFKCR